MQCLQLIKISKSSISTSVSNHAHSIHITNTRSFGIVILLQKYEPQVTLEEIHYRNFHQQEELMKIFDFIELPQNLQTIEQQNSGILRTYYANALDHNLIDIKTVKYLYNQNIRGKGITERAVEQYIKAEQWLQTQKNEPISIGMLYQLQQLLILNLYNNRDDVNLFSTQAVRSPEKLSPSAEMELEELFEFMNNDTDYHPVVQSWILHFRLLNIRLFSEAQTKMASLLQHFWLSKKGMDAMGLLSVEHELYLNKNEYQNFFGEEATITDLQSQVNFGMEMYSEQVNRIKMLLRSYFRKQVDFDKLNPRQKNIMNYVFERGFRLNEFDDKVLNKRQKLIMYIIQHKGFISTKELVNEFECNRKTIQRDFNALVELNLVKVIGQGAGLKYSVNLVERNNNGLSKYQTDLIAEEVGELFE